jgi:hypothetical protein
MDIYNLHLRTLTCGNMKNVSALLRFNCVHHVCYTTQLLELPDGSVQQYHSSYVYCNISHEKKAN